MSKLVLAACVMLALFSATAEATTIEITSGSVWMYQLGLFDTCFFTDTERLLVNTCNNGSFQLMPPLSGTTLTRFYVQRARLDGIWHDGPAPPGPPFFVTEFNLRMLFLHQPISDVPMITAPFTMTGTLNLFDPLTNDPVVVDLIGQGTIQCCRTPDPLGSSFQLVAVEFNFEPGPTSVPEPSSLSLLAGAFWPLLVVAMRKKFKG